MLKKTFIALLALSLSLPGYADRFGLDERFHNDEPEYEPVYVEPLDLNQSRAPRLLPRVILGACAVVIAFSTYVGNELHKLQVKMEPLREKLGESPPGLLGTLDDYAVPLVFIGGALTVAYPTVRHMRSASKVNHHTKNLAHLLAAVPQDILRFYAHGNEVYLWDVLVMMDRAARGRGRRGWALIDYLRNAPETKAYWLKEMNAINHYIKGDLDAWFTRNHDYVQVSDLTDFCHPRVGLFQQVIETVSWTLARDQSDPTVK